MGAAIFLQTPLRVTKRTTAHHVSIMNDFNIAALKQQSGEIPFLAPLVAQLQSRAAKETRNGKPYLELVFADATGNISLKIWSDSPVFARAADLPEGEIVRIEAKWVQNGYGIDAKELDFHCPDDTALELFFSGDPALAARQENDYADITTLLGTISDPRLHTLCQLFLAQMGTRFRRTAAARKNHHARRGGLVEHVAQMMRSANALCGVYHELNRDLMLTGILFHDCGKLWENTYPEHGFAQQTSLPGEMLGHISLGIECANYLWREMMDSENAATWQELRPTPETTRLHLLHLIASHHGELQFGSPVCPRTPEAFALHYIDNLDAKLEMVREAYRNASETSPGIYERMFPLPANLVKPLDPCL